LGVATGAATSKKPFQRNTHMASKKTKSETTTAKGPKLKGTKAKEFPHIAEALTKPLGDQPAEGEAKAAEADKAEPAKTKKASKSKEKKPKKIGALDAAARILEEAGQPMGCKEMIEGMATKGYWTSPNGQTPHATLYAGILREMKVKGKESRFTKSDRGKFARTK
jgi:HB1, ASXL, restriction endonuclease HTH domain